jgi:hypothetical protein
MRKMVKQRLCGGTFFTLLLQARKPRTGVRERYMAIRDGLSEPETLTALAKVIVPDMQTPLESMDKTIKGNAFDFKTCLNSGGMYFPFGDADARAAFDTRVKTEYWTALAAMSEFVDGFIDAGGSTKKDERLVRALVELIGLDDSIEDTQRFYICEDGSAVAKSDILDATEFCFQPFLLGIWHFTVLRKEGNTIGQQTYEAWCPSQGGGQRTYTAKLGENLPGTIRLSYYALEAPIFEAEIVDDARDKEAAEREEQAAFSNAPPGVTQQVINNNPAFFNLNVTGNYNNFYNKVDTVIIKTGGRKDE